MQELDLSDGFDTFGRDDLSEAMGNIDDAADDRPTMNKTGNQLTDPSYWGTPTWERLLGSAYWGTPTWRA